MFFPSFFFQKCQLSVTNKQNNTKNFFEGGLLTVPVRVLECVLKVSYIEFPKTVGQPDALLFLVNNAVSLL